MSPQQSGFRQSSDKLKAVWLDFYACRWSAGIELAEVAADFAGLNHYPVGDSGDDIAITYLQFLPRIDLMLAFAAPQHAMLYPVLGSSSPERQLRRLQSRIHVYGHVHLKRSSMG
jgi:hypothetical protein